MADFARGELFRQLRDDRHLSQLQVALEIGVTEKTIRTWESGGTIRWTNATRVAKFYGVSPEELVSRDIPVAVANPGSQLDRIEAKLARLLEHFQIADVADDVAGVTAALEEELPDVGPAPTGDGTSPPEDEKRESPRPARAPEKRKTG